MSSGGDRISGLWLEEARSRLGIDLLGVVSAPALDQYSGLEVQWDGYRLKKTTDYLPRARSVLVLGFEVWDEMCDLAVLRGPHEERHYMGEMLFSLRQRDLALELKQAGVAVYAGYANLSYKNAARLAGLGSFGKNSLIITPDFGPRVRLRLLITDAELEDTGPRERDWCGECTLCLEACPMGALTPYRVDAHRCLVGQHLLNQPLPPRLVSVHQRQLSASTHIMCGTCQKVCPYFAAPDNQ